MFTYYSTLKQRTNCDHSKMFYKWADGACLRWRSVVDFSNVGPSSSTGRIARAIIYFRQLPNIVLGHHDMLADRIYVILSRIVGVKAVPGLLHHNCFFPVVAPVKSAIVHD